MHKTANSFNDNILSVVSKRLKKMSKSKKYTNGIWII